MQVQRISEQKLNKNKNYEVTTFIWGTDKWIFYF